MVNMLSSGRLASLHGENLFSLARILLCATLLVLRLNVMHSGIWLEVNITDKSKRLPLLSAVHYSTGSGVNFCFHRCCFVHCLNGWWIGSQS